MSFVNDKHLMTELNTLLTFEPYFKPVLWGGDRIAALKHIESPRRDIGESWEISAVPGHESVVADGPLKGQSITALVDRYGASLVGTEVAEKWGNLFPLLIKFIDARRDLSVQVHPDDEMALRCHSSRGKTEMWYVVDADPGSVIYAGFPRETSPESFFRSAHDGTLLDNVSRFEASRGQFYYIPAGTVHAIGAGVLIAEIQETSDISYRIYDYGRKDSDGNMRRLHIDEAREAIDFRPDTWNPCRIPDESNANIIECDFFRVDYITPSSGSPVTFENPESGSFSIIMAVHGDLVCRIGGTPFSLPIGHTGLVPASVRSFSVESGQPFLLVSHPLRQ